MLPRMIFTSDALKITPASVRVKSNIEKHPRFVEVLII